MDDDIVVIDNLWTLYKNDMVNLERLLLRDATVRLKNGLCIKGVIQSIDPITQSIFLAEISNDVIVSLNLLMGSRIQEVLVEVGRSKYADIVGKLFKQETTLSPAELTQLRDKLFEHLSGHHLPCSMDGDIIKVANLARIEPPYSTKEIFCQNEIIMERITKLVNDMTSPT